MPETNAFALSGELTIAAAAQVREQLLVPLAQAAAELQVNLQQIEACDSAGVQLLLALRNSLAADGKSLKLIDASAAVTQALTPLGLSWLADNSAEALA